MRLILIFFAGLALSSPCKAMPLRFSLLYLGQEDPTFAEQVREIASREKMRLQSETHRDCSGLKLSVIIVPSEQRMLPSRRVFELTSKGINQEMTDRIYHPGAAIGVSAESSIEDLKVLNLWAARVLAIAAEVGNCAVQDVESRQFLSADYWRKLRVETWTGLDPDLYSHISIHLFRNPELVRAVTLGMGKFGRPELTIDSFASSQSDPITILITAIGQHIAETSYSEGSANFVVSSLSNLAAKNRIASWTIAGENARFEYATQNVEPQDGDAKGAQAKVDFDIPQVSEYRLRIAAAIGTVFKTEQELKYAKGDDAELLEARDRARKLFLTKKAVFQKGLEPTERILIKAPFTFEGSTEYKWLELIEWKGGTLTGILLSPSVRDPNLKPGQQVEILVSALYDYLHVKENGEEEGNETGKILEGRSR